MNPGALGVKKLAAVSDLVRLPRQQGTLLLLWPTLWSLTIASYGNPSVRLLIIFVAGTFLMRSAGCAFNDIADRNFDPHVERTKSRPLADGRLSVREALLVILVLTAAAFALVLQLNRLTVLLSLAGLLFAGVYPFVKRFSHFPQVMLGIAFGWGSIMAWSAVRGSVSIVPVLIFAANIFWAAAYDTIYALMDKDDDLKIGVKSTAIFFGDSVYKALVVMYLCAAFLLVMAGRIAGLGNIYFGGLAVCLGLFILTVIMVKNKPVRATAQKGFSANASIGGLLLSFILMDMNF